MESFTISLFIFKFVTFQLLECVLKFQFVSYQVLVLALYSRAYFLRNGIDNISFIFAPLNVFFQSVSWEGLLMFVEMLTILSLDQ
jgi:hypothetical protein